jgi:hypothetical protein
MEQDRLAEAMNRAQCMRDQREHTLLVLDVYNPRTERRHHIELVSDRASHSSRFRVDVDGERAWRRDWSRTYFCRWMMRQIDRVTRNRE